MKNEEEIIIVEQATSDVVFQQDKAMIDVQIATAQQFPRNVKQCIEDVVALVTLDKDIAATCTYSVPRGGKAITGPSVHLARMLAQSWGNLRVESKVVNVDMKQITSQAICFDLQKNLAVKVEVKKTIWGKNGRYNEDMIVTTGNASNSIALRNAVFNVIPRGVVDKCYKAAQATVIGDVSTEAKLIAKRKQVLDQLKDTYKVTEAEILSAIGKASTSHITSDDLITLVGIGTAIKDGDTTIESAFRKQKENMANLTKDQIQQLFDEALPMLDEKNENDKRLIADAERILKGNEVNSFQKLEKRLREKLPAKSE